MACKTISIRLATTLPPLLVIRPLRRLVVEGRVVMDDLPAQFRPRTILPRHSSPVIPEADIECCSLCDAPDEAWSACLTCGTVICSECLHDHIEICSRRLDNIALFPETLVYSRGRFVDVSSV